MDFQTMQSKCSCGSYRSVQDFLSDMKQVFANAEQYNQNGSHVLSCLEKTEQCLIDMLHKHLPGHTYMRRKRKRSLVQPGQELREADGDSDPEALEYTRGRKRKKWRVRDGTRLEQVSAGSTALMGVQRWKLLSFTLSSPTPFLSPAFPWACSNCCQQLINQLSTEKMDFWFLNCAHSLCKLRRHNGHRDEWMEPFSAGDGAGFL